MATKTRPPFQPGTRLRFPANAGAIGFTTADDLRSGNMSMGCGMNPLIPGQDYEVLEIGGDDVVKIRYAGSPEVAEEQISDGPYVGGYGIGHECWVDGPDVRAYVVARTTPNPEAKTIHAVLQGCGAVFRDDAGFYLSRASTPSVLEPLDEAMAMAFVAKWGYVRTRALEIDPAMWPTRKDLTLERPNAVHEAVKAARRSGVTEDVVLEWVRAALKEAQ